ncbi:MAG: TVP38/TMEM64 family protein [Nitrospira sp.]|nr:TVP38/TMEM64 family protein [Nitrospira sp.]
METQCNLKHSCDCEIGHPNRSPHEVGIFSESAKGPRSGKLIIAAVMGLAIGAFFWFDLGSYLTLETVKANRARLLAFTDEHQIAAVVSFVVSYAVVTGLSLPGATILTLVGGFLFGSVLGTAFVNLGATSGATLAFLTARYLLRGWVEQTFGQKLGPIQEGFAKNAFSYLITLRLVPLFPFFLVNLVSGLTRVHLGTYVLATAIGIIPGSFVYAYAGRQLGTINSLKEIASPNVILAFTLLGLLALVPILYRRFASKPAEPVNQTEIPSHR